MSALCASNCANIDRNTLAKGSMLMEDNCHIAGYADIWLDKRVMPADKDSCL